MALQVRTKRRHSTSRRAQGRVRGWQGHRGKEWPHTTPATLAPPSHPPRWRPALENLRAGAGVSAIRKQTVDTVHTSAQPEEVSTVCFDLQLVIMI